MSLPVICLTFLLLGGVAADPAPTEPAAVPQSTAAEPASAAANAGDPAVDRDPAFDSEIVVTARRREEDMLEVPISITALDGAELEAGAVRDLAAVDVLAPNLDFSLSGGAGGSPAEATVYIRGIGQIEPGIFADPGVGIYVDGVYIARSQGAVLELLDLERVEVLRGPQGTLFGKNTTGGALRLITRKPSADFGGAVRGRLGNLDRRDLGLRVGGALGERVFASLAASHRERDGYATSLATDQGLSDEDTLSARAALRFLVGEGTVVDLALDATRERETALDQGVLEVFPATPLLDFYNRVRIGSDLVSGGLVPLDERFVTGDLDTSFSDFPSRNDGDVLLARLHLSHVAPRFALSSITAWREVEYDGASDFDGTPQRFFDRRFRQEQDQLSQELQFSGTAHDDRLEWTAGGLYFEENPVDDSLTFSWDGLFDLLEAAPGPVYSPPGAPAFLCDPGPPPRGVPCFGGAGNPANFFFFVGEEGIAEVLDIETRSWSLFGDATIALGDRLSLSAGLRLTFEEKDFEVTTDPRNAPPRQLSDEEDWDALSPRLSLSWAPHDGLLVYGSASRGFKSGGFNAGRSLSRSTLAPYDQETLWAYEAGVKRDFGRGRSRLTGAFFYYDYDDVQFASFLVVEGELFLVIQNAADARISGGELEFETRPSDTWRITGSVGYTDTEYTELRNEGGAPQDGEVPKTPPWTFRLAAEYTFELAEDAALVLHGGYSYRDDSFNDVANTPELVQSAYGTVDARLVYERERFDVGLWGTNLGDESYLEHGFNSGPAGLITGIAAPPREWGVSFTWRY